MADLLNGPVADFQASEEQVKKTTDDLMNQMQGKKPEDIAAEVFQMYLPMYRMSLKNLNRKELMKLCDALVSHPLEDLRKDFRDQKAKATFELANRLNDAKMIMRDFVMFEDFLVQKEAGTINTDGTNNETAAVEPVAQGE